jgi:hypothetical protein
LKAFLTLWEKKRVVVDGFLNTPSKKMQRIVIVSNPWPITKPTSHVPFVCSSAAT